MKNNLRNIQNTLLKRAEVMTEDLDKNTRDYYLNSIKGAINKVTNEMNHQNINYVGGFQGWRK